MSDNLKEYHLESSFREKLPKWKCYRCGQVYDMETPPDSCSNCNARVSFWIDWTESESPLDISVGKFATEMPAMMDGNDNAWNASKLMREKGMGSILVSQKEKPVGIVTEKDILYKIVAENLPPSHVMLRKIMSSPLVTVTEDTPVREAIQLMEEKGFRRLIVVKKDGSIGALTHYDLVNQALRASPVP